ncbi:MAG: CCA tRNA nucleotidyltransferase [Actinomycetota bacterium]|nr:CCA tRNA nucleotidyltransferase [Actinomycetota bacterium]
MDTAQRRAVAELLRVAPVIDDLGARFAAAGYELHLVGGSVRDALLGRLGNDLDFATDARPEQVLELAQGWAEATWDTGISFGTVGLSRRGFTLEVTTFRSEAYDSSSRHPQVRYGESLAEDLVRRDFTVNAMAISLQQHLFLDPHGGLVDLAGKLLRTPGRPEDSFDDDPLRMLRAARFASQLGFTVDPGVVTAATDMAARLAIISAERKQAELSKLLLGRHPKAGLELLVDTGLAEHVLPELPAMRLEIDPLHQHKDVYAHTLAVLDRAIALEPAGPDLTLRMAALLHDIGKPRTRAKEPGGGVSFHHHEVVGASMTRTRLKALRYPKRFTDEVATLVKLHLRFHGYGTGAWSDAAVRRYVSDAGPLLDRLNRLVRSDCTTRNRSKAAALSAAYDELEERIARLREQEAIDALRPDLDGAAVMTLLGIPPGPVVGRALRHLLELRTEHGPLGYDAAVAELHRWAAEQGLTPTAG